MYFYTPTPINPKPFYVPLYTSFFVYWETSKVHKKTSLGGGGGGIQPVFGVTECKVFILNLHAGRQLITVTFDHFPV